MIRDQGLTSKIWRFAVWAVAALFILNLLAVIAVVIINSFSTRWLGTWLPAGWTTRWYFSAWKEFQLDSVLVVTFEIVFTVVLLSGLLGVPAAYALARRNFPGKKLAMLLFLLPLLVPPMTFGIPLATVLCQVGLGGTFWGVVLANRRCLSSLSRWCRSSSRSIPRSKRQRMCSAPIYSSCSGM